MATRLSDPSIEFDDIIQNNNPRVPVCIAVEMSGKSKKVASYEARVKELFEKLPKAAERAHVDDLIDLCIVSFGDKPDVVRDYSLINNKEVKEPEFIGGAPDYEAALDAAYRRYLAQKRKYRACNTMYYLPVFLFVCAGISPSECKGRYRMLAEQFRFMDDTGQATVVPFTIGGNDTYGLTLVSSDGQAMELDANNIQRKMDLFTQSVAQLSQSTSNTSMALKEGSIAWNEFKRK